MLFHAIKQSAESVNFASQGRQTSVERLEQLLELELWWMTARAVFLWRGNLFITSWELQHLVNTLLYMMLVLQKLIHKLPWKKYAFLVVVCPLVRALIICWLLVNAPLLHAPFYCWCALNLVCWAMTTNRFHIMDFYYTYICDFMILCAFWFAVRSADIAQ